MNEQQPQTNQSLAMLPGEQAHVFVFWKVLMIVWLVILSLLASFGMPIPEGEVISSFIIGLFIFLLPISVVITFITKWIFELRRSMKKEAAYNNPPISTPPKERIWKWYLILAVVYYSLVLITQFLLRYNIVDTDNLDLIWPILIVWPLFNLGIFAVIFSTKIEKVALLLPLLTFPHLMPFSGFFSPLDVVSLWIAVYLISRK